MSLFITSSDITLVKRLDTITYHKLTMNGEVSKEDQSTLADLKNRLKRISDNFKGKYDQQYGIFRSEQARGNPIGRSKRLRKVWSGIYKGTSNKQYSAQISFVINTINDCLDVGFYFGRASSHQLSLETKIKLERDLKQLGSKLVDEINTNQEVNNIYTSLFDFGFKAEIDDERVSPDQWLANASNDPAYSSIVFGLRPNSHGYIDLATIDVYVSLVLPLMSIIPENIDETQQNQNRGEIKALTPEQRAKQAERRALIGLHGEEYAMEYEKRRIAFFNNNIDIYPCHKALISDDLGYDILSYNENQTILFIEVKTTTRLRGDPLSKEFYLSASEYLFYTINSNNYKLYRVYDIYGNPEIEIIDLSTIRLSITGYKAIMR